MNSRVMKRKKSTLSEVKVAVIGAPGVGKTALSVRFLTRRYIGEYDHKSDTRYKHEVLIDNDPILYEILDTCPKVSGFLLPKSFQALNSLRLLLSENEICQDYNDFPTNETLNWADCLLLVYSICDRNSFSFLKKVGALIPDNDIPLYIVGNKNDMSHLREVSVEEGAILARSLECGFSEVAAAEQVAPVAVVFQEVCRAVLASRRKSKHSLLERMLGTRSSNLRVYARGKSDSALPKD
ncbi:ras-related and estrogen-regulated growth inhibitor-like protein isoform X1 [Euwallacea similis]|uniref:ras-related and estrogen-regulated growth inhibitor-like protein isoform X1 n=1 Tax=Euwallacea similis TaxID=1736056 RepID=UPI00344C84CF